LSGFQGGDHQAGFVEDPAAGESEYRHRLSVEPVRIIDDQHQGRSAVAEQGEGGQAGQQRVGVAGRGQAERGLQGRPLPERQVRCPGQDRLEQTLQAGEADR
jgi:hypothetical protein